MNLQPILENDLVMLRPLRKTDFELLYEVAKDPMIWEQHPNNDRYKIEIYTEFFADSINSKGALIIVEKSTNKVIGSSRYNRIDNVENAIEIGWSFLSREYWGGRFNGSIKKLMIEHAFKFVEDIIFYIGKDNIRSQKAVMKIGGGRITGDKLKHLIKEGEADWTYRISKGDWKKSREM